MSLIQMTRKCVHCRRIYRYDLSAGILELFCKYCHRPQR